MWLYKIEQKNESIPVPLPWKPQYSVELKQETVKTSVLIRAYEKEKGKKKDSIKNVRRSAEHNSEYGPVSVFFSRLPLFDALVLF